MKQNEKPIYSVLWRYPWAMARALFVCFMLMVTGLLYFEYRSFNKEVRDLVELKSAYHENLLALRQHLAFKEAEVADQEQAADGKKKVLNQDGKADSDSSFLVVNREYDYLKREALKFAREHNLDTRLDKLYDKVNVADSGANARSRGSGATRTSKRPAVSVKKAKWQQFLRPVMRPDSNIAAVRMAVPMAAPVKKSQYWLSSVFGPRKNPSGKWGFHNGVDMAAIKGTPVYAAAPGVVVEAGVQPGYGKTIVIMHQHKAKTRYAHLDKIKVVVGRKVAQGEQIGTVGNTGNVRGKKGHDASHLHFEVIVAGKRVNPLYFLN